MKPEAATLKKLEWLSEFLDEWKKAEASGRSFHIEKLSDKGRGIVVVDFSTLRFGPGDEYEIVYSQQPRIERYVVCADGCERQTVSSKDDAIRRMDDFSPRNARVVCLVELREGEEIVEKGEVDE